MFEEFGYSVAALGNDRVLIGSFSRGAYLFRTDGTLITSFKTPAGGVNHGHSVAALGNDRVVSAAGSSLAAYLFTMETYSSGVIAAGVRAGAITRASLANDAVNSAKIEDGTVATADLANGAVTAAKIGGVLLESQIPGLDASKITGGTLADARLSTNVALLNRSPQAFTGTNTFAGNVGIGTTTPTNKLHVLGGATFSSGIFGANQTVAWAPGNASWSFTSDRNSKEKLAPVNAASVLEKVARLPIAEWSYLGYAQRHIGPMAQDFHEQFPLNDSDTTLNDADLHGVALAAIQGLNEKIEAGSQRSEVRIQKLAAENADLKQEVAELKRLLNQLRTRLSGGGQ